MAVGYSFGVLWASIVKVNLVTVGYIRAENARVFCAFVLTAYGSTVRRGQVILPLEIAKGSPVQLALVTLGVTSCSQPVMLPSSSYVAHEKSGCMTSCHRLQTQHLLGNRSTLEHRIDMLHPQLPEPLLRLRTRQRSPFSSYWYKFLHRLPVKANTGNRWG